MWYQAIPGNQCAILIKLIQSSSNLNTCCWPALYNLGIPCKSLQGNSFLIQIALAFCWLPCKKNFIGTLLSQVLHIRANYSFKSRLPGSLKVLWQLPEVREAFYRTHTMQWDPLKAFNRGNAITRLVHSHVPFYKATRAFCQIQSCSWSIQFFFSSLFLFCASLNIWAHIVALWPLWSENILLKDWLFPAGSVQLRSHSSAITCLSGVEQSWFSRGVYWSHKWKG